jgi:hypothetical protein
MKKFLTGNSFSKKTTTDTTVPLLLSAPMMNIANSLHSTIDNWKTSTTTKIVSLLGWGLPTPAGVVVR